MRLNKNFDELPRDGTPVLVLTTVTDDYPKSYFEEIRWGYSNTMQGLWFSLCFSNDKFDDADLEEIFIGFIIHPMKKEILVEDYNGEVPHK